MNFARSIEPVVSAEHSITRMAVTTEKEAEQQSGDNRTMGRKFTIPYGLYRCHGFISANLAKQTDFSEDDLTLFWDALVNMLDHDRSASRGEMSPCALYIFKHDSALGNAPARKLFELIEIKRQSEGPARDFRDYQVTVQEDKLPKGVELINYLD